MGGYSSLLHWLGVLLSMEYVVDSWFQQVKCECAIGRMMCINGIAHVVDTGHLKNVKKVKMFMIILMT